jgi:uncharacterized protein (DUF2235 family)
MRRLVILADGTWNSENGKEDGSGTTNVVRMRQGITPVAADGTKQIVEYFPGVGNGGWWDRVTGGAFGSGISRNIKACYAFLIREYELGDHLFFFGFSRGAYTVRSLAGLVRNSGVLRRDQIGRVDEAYDLYRDRDKDTHPNSPKAEQFRDAYAVEAETRIKCLGVWDTVGSLGVPTRGLVGMISRRRHGFHDVKLSSRVENAFHALAIDERRGPFEPTLWTVRESDPARTAGTWRIEQRWFAGVHSNIGGGYADRGLSCLTLRWMVDRAQGCGLDFDPNVLAEVERGCDCGARLYDSLSWFYRRLPQHERKLDQVETDEDSGERLYSFEDVDSSVIARYAKGLNPKYAPDNFLHYWRRYPDKWAPDHNPTA